jgi:hypothetical protein
MEPPETVICTWTGPYGVSAAWPVKLPFLRPEDEPDDPLLPDEPLPEEPLPADDPDDESDSSDPDDPDDESDSSDPDDPDVPDDPDDPDVDDPDVPVVVAPAAEVIRDSPSDVR